MVNYKVYPDNLPNTNKEIEQLLEKLLKEKVLNNPKYNYKELGIEDHSGTQFTINHKCTMNFKGVLVIHILGAYYEHSKFYSTAFFNAEIQKKLNAFEEYLRTKPQ